MATIGRTYCTYSQPCVRLPHRSRPRRAVPKAVCAGPRARLGGGYGGLADFPGLEIRRGGWDADRDLDLDGGEVQTEAGSNYGNVDRQRSAPPGGGNYRVLLLNSPQHSEKSVVRAITSVVPGSDEAHARNCFATSKQLGMAIIISCLKEHAEFYAHELYRHGCRTAIEPDNAAA